MKTLDYVMAALGAIGILGSLALVWILVEFGAGLTALETAQVPDVGAVSGSSIDPMISTAKTIVLVGSVWSLCVLAVSCYALYSAYTRIRGPPKK